MFEAVDQAIQDFYEKVPPATLKLKGAGAGGGIAGGCVPLLRQVSYLELTPAWT